jgi:hypothetical protein
MSIEVTIENPIDARVKLKARKTLDGNILILDHPDIDIVISPKKKKVLALAKNQYNDHVYATQSRLFEYLRRRGVVDPASVHGGNVYGSLEGAILESIEPHAADSVQMTLYSIVHFLIEEKPHYDALKKYEFDFEKNLLDPSEKDSTELGDVPHNKRKGSVTQYSGVNTAYGIYGTMGE